VFSLTTGSFLRKFGSYGKKLKNPIGIIVTPSTTVNEFRVVVADSSNNRVQILDGIGNSIREFGSNDSMRSRNMWPVGIAYDNDILAVCDQTNDRIILFK